MKLRRGYGTWDRYGCRYGTPGRNQGAVRYGTGEVLVHGRRTASRNTVRNSLQRENHTCGTLTAVRNTGRTSAQRNLLPYAVPFNAAATRPYYQNTHLTVLATQTPSCQPNSFQPRPVIHPCPNMTPSPG